MATKAEAVDVEDLLDYIDKTMERLKTLYEQYFLGMQKQAPAHLHNDIERRIRDLMQTQIRNTGLRYRFATLQQKFGSYNSYWRRTLRQIEQGTYIRQLAKISRKAAETGEEIPDEILAAMPKRMREQVKRDREQALAIAARKRRDATESDINDVSEDQVEGESSGEIPVIGESPMVRNAIRKNQHVLTEADADIDIDAFFASVTDDTNPDAKAFPSLGDDDEPTGIGAPPKFPPPRAAPAAPARASQPAARPSQPAPAPLQQSWQTQAIPRAQTEQMGSDPITGQPRQAFDPRQPPPRQSQPIARPVMGSDPITGQPIDRSGGFDPMTGQPVRPSQIKPGAPAGFDARQPPPPRQSQPIARPVMGSDPITGQPRPPVADPYAGQRPPPQQSQPIARPVMGSDPITGQRPLPPQQQSQPLPTEYGQVPGPPPPLPQAGVRFVAPNRAGTQPGVAPPAPPNRTGPVPVVPPNRTGAVPVVPAARPQPFAPSQVTRPNPIAPGSSQQRPQVPVQSMPGPFPRPPRPEPAPPQRPPPGMNDADVNALYAKYVKAKQAVGEDAGPGAYGKLLKTINAQAPKIMEQYKAKGVEFSVVVKDNQVIIKAKPKP